MCSVCFMIRTLLIKWLHHFSVKTTEIFNYDADFF